jgi:precorrin-8X/cobalt-precorrin-8 methylmutase
MEADYTDIGATTTEALEISRKSRQIISDLIGDLTLEDKIKQRCVIATGDPSVGNILEFCHDPVQAGLKALHAGARIFTDIKMVEMGIVKKGHNSAVMTLLGSGDSLAASSGITRTSAGVFSRQNELSGAIIVIGNAPSALMALCELIESGMVMPALVIGAPVGFVNADKSKEQLRKAAVPSISTVGTRGGTPIAVAAINEIINMHDRSMITKTPSDCA